MKTIPISPRAKTISQQATRTRCGMTPEELIAFAPPAATKERVWDLIYRQKTVGLMEEEQAELEVFMQFEHLMRVAKAHARQLLPPEST